MDNLYFKRLPTDALPKMSGQNTAIVMSSSGVLFVVTPEGAEEIVRIDRLEPLLERLTALEDNAASEELALKLAALEGQIAPLLARIEALEAKSHKHKVIK